MLDSVSCLSPSRKGQWWSERARDSRAPGVRPLILPREAREGPCGDSLAPDTRLTLRKRRSRAPSAPWILLLEDSTSCVAVRKPGERNPRAEGPGHLPQPPQVVPWACLMEKLRSKAPLCSPGCLRWVIGHRGGSEEQRPQRKVSAHI